MQRTHYCGDLSEKEVGSTVTLKGWVQIRRDLGGLIFLDLRDRAGVVQTIFNPAISKEALEIAETIRNEYVISITGKVIERQESQKNPNIQTGAIEVQVESVEIINKAKNTAIYY